MLIPVVLVTDDVLHTGVSNPLIMVAEDAFPPSVPQQEEKYHLEGEISLNFHYLNKIHYSFPFPFQVSSHQYRVS